MIFVFMPDYRRAICKHEKEKIEKQEMGVCWRGQDLFISAGNSDIYTLSLRYVRWMFFPVCMYCCHGGYLLQCSASSQNGWFL